MYFIWELEFLSFIFQILDMPEIRGHEFDVGENYADLEFVGEGAYGIVVRANDRANGNRVGKNVQIQVQS